MKESPSDEDILNISDTKEENQDPPRISMFNPSDKNGTQTIIKPKKRRQSLPIKSFKVSCPNESKTLSLICDNIFEDDVINNNINSSMIKIKSKINIKNTFNNEEEHDIKKSSSTKIFKSKTIKEEEKKEDDEEDDDFPKKQRTHKKSFIFNNLLKIKNIKCPRLLEDQWKYEKILLDYNIIDFTSKIKYI